MSFGCLRACLVNGHYALQVQQTGEVSGFNRPLRNRHVLSDPCCAELNVAQSCILQKVNVKTLF
jgi:hypothetical protein